MQFDTDTLNIKSGSFWDQTVVYIFIVQAHGLVQGLFNCIRALVMIIDLHVIIVILTILLMYLLVIVELLLLGSNINQ